MSTPAANMVVQNNSSGAITMGGATVQPGAGNAHTYNATQIGPLCLDLTFRAAYVAGLLSVTVNGFGVDPDSPQTTDLLDQIGAGTIG